MLAFASFVDSLRHAADEADFSRQIYCSWKIIADDPARLVSSSSGVEVMPHAPLDDAGDINYLVVVGGILPACYEIGARTRQFIVDAYKAGISIVGLCTGSFILADVGLLEGRRCAVHNEHIATFRDLYPGALATPDEVFVDDCHVLTSLGGTSSLDLAFHLIDMHCGKARAMKGITSLLVHTQVDRRNHYRPYGHLAGCGNRKIEMAIEIMERHITSPLPIEAVAKRVGCSTRELSRLFKKYGGKTPSATWRNMRIAHGHWLLINSDRCITQIAYECGFADSAHFNRCFKSVYNASPNIYRKRRQMQLGEAMAV
jgi:transcriptional regulator GlxA family with amidase domain